MSLQPHVINATDGRVISIPHGTCLTASGSSSHTADPRPYSVRTSVFPVPDDVGDVHAEIVTTAFSGFEYVDALSARSVRDLIEVLREYPIVEAATKDSGFAGNNVDDLPDRLERVMAEQARSLQKQSLAELPYAEHV